MCIQVAPFSVRKYLHIVIVRETERRFFDLFFQLSELVAQNLHLLHKNGPILFLLTKCASVRMWVSIYHTVNDYGPYGIQALCIWANNLGTLSQYQNLDLVYNVQLGGGAYILKSNCSHSTLRNYCCSSTVRVRRLFQELLRFLHEGLKLRLRLSLHLLLEAVVS